jgi:hypothetical protein
MEASDIDLGEYDADEMQEEYEEKCNEVVELRHELRASQLEAQQLRMRLKGMLPSAGSLTTLPDSGVTEEKRRCVETQTFFEWLAACMDLSHSEELDVGFQVPVQGRQIVLGNMTQWRSREGTLRLSVPTEFSKEILSALMAAQSSAGNTEESVGQQLADSWELLQTFISVSGRPEPAVWLVRRGQEHGAEQSMLVASWPSREDVESSKADAERDVNELSIGMRVEVQYEGQWYCGVLHAVDVSAGRASVICDVDAPGVITHAPVASLRALGGVTGNSKRETIDHIALQHDCQRERVGSRRRSRSAL